MSIRPLSARVQLFSQFLQESSVFYPQLSHSEPKITVLRPFLLVFIDIPLFFDYSSMGVRVQVRCAFPRSLNSSISQEER